MEGVLYYIKNLWSVFKSIPLLTKIATLFFAILTPYSSIIHLLLFFVVLDLLTGIYASCKQHMLEHKPVGFSNKLCMCWHHIESKKLRWSVEKLLVYMTIILVTATFEFFYIPIVVGTYTLSKLIIGILTLTEIRSIFENLATIMPNGVVSTVFRVFSKKIKDETGLSLDQESETTDKS